MDSIVLGVRMFTKLSRAVVSFFLFSLHSFTSAACVVCVASQFCSSGLSGFTKCTSLFLDTRPLGCIVSGSKCLASNVKSGPGGNNLCSADGTDGQATRLRPLAEKSAFTNVALGEKNNATERGDAACDAKSSGSVVGFSCGGGKADFVNDQTRLKVPQDVLDRLLTIDFVTGTFLQFMTENAMLLNTTLLVPPSEMGSGEVNLFRPSLKIPKHVSGKLEKRGDPSILSGSFNVSPVAITETSRVLIVSLKSEGFEGKTISITIQRDDSPKTSGKKDWILTNWYFVR